MSREAIQEKVLNTAAAVFQVSADDISVTSSLQDIPTWDSIAHLNFILALEQEFQCSFTQDEIEALTTLDSVVNTLTAKGLVAS